MGKIFFDIGISLDGYMAGEHRGPRNPLGDNGLKIHSWMFKQKAFWKHINQEDVAGTAEDGADGKIIEDTFARTGAYIMGKRMFEEGEANWAEDLFKKPVYILTHEIRKPWVQKGSTTFFFVNDGIESALRQARQTSKGKDIRIQGGGDTVQQFFNAGYVEEFTIHIAPVLLRSGIRLFDHLNDIADEITIAGIKHSDLTTHITYKLKKG